MVTCGHLELMFLIALHQQQHIALALVSANLLQLMHQLAGLVSQYVVWLLAPSSLVIFKL